MVASASSSCAWTPRFVSWSSKYSALYGDAMGMWKPYAVEVGEEGPRGDVGRVKTGDRPPGDRPPGDRGEYVPLWATKWLAMSSSVASSLPTVRLRATRSRVLPRGPSARMPARIDVLWSSRSSAFWLRSRMRRSSRSSAFEVSVSAGSGSASFATPSCLAHESHIWNASSSRRLRAEAGRAGPRPPTPAAGVPGVSGGIPSRPSTPPAPPHPPPRPRAAGL